MRSALGYQGIQAGFVSGYEQQPVSRPAQETRCGFANSAAGARNNNVFGIHSLQMKVYFGMILISISILIDFGNKQGHCIVTFAADF